MQQMMLLLCRTAKVHMVLYVNYQSSNTALLCSQPQV